MATDPKWMGREAQDMRTKMFWKVPLPSECIEFVDSTNSEGFSRFLLALEKASIIAMDAEWKPIFGRSAVATFPRVSILQIACRLRHTSGVRNEVEENSRHFKVIPAATVEVQKASWMSRRTKPEDVSGLELAAYGYDEGDDSEEEVEILSGSESDRGVDDLPRSKEIGGNSLNTRNTKGWDGKEFCGALARAQAREMPNWDEEELKFAKSLSPEIDNAVAKVRELSVTKLKSPQVQRDLSPSGSSRYRSRDRTQVTDLSTDQRKCEGNEGVLKDSGYGTPMDAQTEMGKETKTWHEMIFLLDLLTLPVSAFCEALKNVFVNKMVLKLGFGFKQDLMNLRATFPGPESRGCFDKVEPYLDVGKLYRHMRQNKSSFRGNSMVIGVEGLASIFESVMGLPLQKV